MIIDIAKHLGAIDRRVERRPGIDGAGEQVSVTLRRSYPAEIEDVWDAITDPERIKRWFMPVSGDLKVGGTFQLQGNAGGEILACEPPESLRLTWGDPSSIADLTLTEDETGTVLELTQTVPIEIARSGAGALWVGPGWDGALMGLGLHLGGETIDDPAAMAVSPEVQEFSRQSVHAWAAAVHDSGTAADDELRAATQISLTQFAPDASGAE
jgi:uncharacterized protein YndB with AHSA1/START domain